MSGLSNLLWCALSRRNGLGSGVRLNALDGIGQIGLGALERNAPTIDLEARETTGSTILIP